jgi:hypothetical protein
MGWLNWELQNIPNHIRNRTHIPISDILVEWRTRKHLPHIRNRTHIPISNGLIELGISEHITHIFVTELTSQFPMGWLNWVSEHLLISVTLLTHINFISTSPHSSPLDEQVSIYNLIRITEDGLSCSNRNSFTSYNTIITDGYRLGIQSSGK